MYRVISRASSTKHDFKNTYPQSCVNDHLMYSLVGMCGHCKHKLYVRFFSALYSLVYNVRKVFHLTPHRLFKNLYGLHFFISIVLYYSVLSYCLKYG